MSEERERKMLAERKRKRIRMTEPKSYEQFKKEEDDSLLSKLADFISPATDVAEDVAKGVGKAASKVGNVLKDSWYRATTPRYVKDREKVIKQKVEGTYKGKD